MIYGRGDISKAITDKEGFTFFCCGASNRIPITDREREREMFRIWSTPKDSMFVYISTLSIYYSDSPYTKHKINMENLVRARFENYCIFRIGNITWGDNPNTLINFLTDKIKNNLPFEIQDTYRYLIEKDEFQHWINLIPSKGKHEMNCTGKRMKVEQIVERIKDNTKPLIEQMRE